MLNVKQISGWKLPESNDGGEREGRPGRPRRGPARAAGLAAMLALAAACGGNLVETAEKPAPLPAESGSRVLQGTVRLGSVGLSGVKVTLSTDGRSTVTDAGGKFQFPVSPGKFTVTPSKEGFKAEPVSLEVEVASHDPMPVEFALHEESSAGTGPTLLSISGGVVSAGEDATGVSLELSGGASQAVTLDGSGRFAFRDLAPGTYTVTPSRGARRFHPVSQTFTLGGADAAGVAFTLLPAYRVSGKVTAAGSPIADAVVALGGAATRTATTGASGAFAFDGLDAGTYTLGAAKEGYRAVASSPASVAVSADVSELKLELERVSTLAGAVLSGGKGVAGVTIALEGPARATATTGASGAFLFEGLPVGSYTLTPVAPGFSFEPPSRTAVLAGADVGGLQFERGHSLSGVVSGVAVAGLEVRAIAVSGGAERKTTTDGAGAFAFACLADGEYEVMPVAAAGLSLRPASARLRVLGAHLAGVAFVQGYAVSGITGATPGAAVRLTGPGGLDLSATSDAAGAFSFEGLLPGAYTAAVAKAGVDFLPPARAFTLGSSAAAITPFQIGHALSGTVSGLPYGMPATVTARDAGGWVVAQTTTGAGGTYAFPHLVAGEYSVTPSLSGYTFSPGWTSVSLASADARRDFTTLYTISGALDFGGCGGSPLSLSLLRSGLLVATGTFGSSPAYAYTFSNLPGGSYVVKVTIRDSAYGNCRPGTIVTLPVELRDENASGGIFRWTWDPAQY